MNELVFFLEEQSAAEMLKGLLPRIVPQGLPVRYITFEGKRDLETQIVLRLQHYRTPNARLVILRDQDSSDCRVVKKALVGKCRQAKRTDVLVRIACHELESWYLADLAAVEQALGIPRLAEKQEKKKYRLPDSLANAAEELIKLTGNRYQKISGSRAIGPHLNLDNNRSPSFKAFVEGIRKIAVDLSENGPLSQVPAGGPVNGSRTL